jgi:hypothetical protein
LPAVEEKIRSAQEFATQAPVKFTQSANGVVLELPASKREVDRIIVLNVAK